MFSNLSQGSLVHILSLSQEGDALRYGVGTVEAIVPETRQYNMSMFNNGYVTLKVTIDGKSREFNQVPINSGIYTKDSCILTDSKEVMISQVENLLQNSKNILVNIDKHKRTIKACEDVLKDINPTFAKETERDETITDLKSKVGGLENKLDKVLSLLANKMEVKEV